MLAVKKRCKKNKGKETAEGKKRKINVWWERTREKGGFNHSISIASPSGL